METMSVSIKDQITAVKAQIEKLEMEGGDETTVSSLKERLETLEEKVPQEEMAEME